MTSASDTRPTRRVARSRSLGDVVIDLRADTITLRPKGRRRGGPAEVTLSIGALYQRELRMQIDQRRREHRLGRSQQRVRR